MERQDLFRKVSVLQAYVRGFLVRRQFQNLRSEYEATVREIEGDQCMVMWSEGWISRPQFLPKPEKMMLKSGESSANSGGLPCQEDGPHLQVVQSKKSRKPIQGKTRDSSRMGNPEGADSGLPYSQLELKKIQHLRSHLAMELLWVQQAINSRKEYLILKQTLRSPEVDCMGDGSSVCLDHVGQACERTDTQPSSPLEDRTTREQYHVDESYCRIKSQSHKLPERLDKTDKTITGVKYRGTSSSGTCLRLMKHLEDQTPKNLKIRHCFEKARTQLLMLTKEPAVKNKSTRRPDYQDANYQRGHESQASQKTTSPEMAPW
ncbi:LOW QUALITY PROTEIN: IQ domain-containing protein C [Rhynchocyon petersi]